MASNLKGITTIDDVIGREILDSRDPPTIEVEVLLMGLARESRIVARSHPQ